jgi:hypothetical protein
MRKVTMPDGQEEREEQRERERLKKQDPEDRVDYETPDDWQPERVDS